MFTKNIDDRLSAWAALRTGLEKDPNPFQTVCKFWKAAPFVPYNHLIDPYNSKSWPTPWEIIAENRYDDFTRALMIAYTVKYTERFANSYIEIQTVIDKQDNLAYNIVFIDEQWALNYADNGPLPAEKLPKSFLVENLVVISSPR